MSERQPLYRDPSWRAVVAAFVLNGLLFGAWASRVPAFKDGFELEPYRLGALLLALAGGAIVSFPFAGALSEKWGADRLTILCSWGYAPSLVLLALAPTPLTLGIALFLFGAFHGAMDVAMNGWGARVEEHLKRSTMSIFHATFSLGAGLGAASGFVAAGLQVPPLWHFALLAIAGGIGALAVMNSTTPLVSKSHENPPAETSFLALPHGPLVFVGLIAFSASLGEGAMADWSAVFLRLVTDANEARAALGYAVFSVMMVITRLLGGVLVESLGPVKTTRICTGIAFLGCLIAIFGGSFGSALFGFALMGVGYAVVMPLVFSRAAADPNVPAGPAIASVATLGYGGMLLGPPVIGFVAQFTGMRLSFLVLAALAFLAMILADKLRVS
ncbi:MAG: MFS transporter [Pseudomonadota bacterium]